MNRILTAVALFASLALPAVARADQLAWLPATGNDAGNVSKALSYMKRGDVVYSYCAPCGDRNATAVLIKTVSVSTPEPGYKEIAINGNGIDLAYIYVKSKGGYVNLGMLGGYAPEQVPEVLPEGKMMKIK